MGPVSPLSQRNQGKVCPCCPLDRPASRPSQASLGCARLSIIGDNGATYLLARPCTARQEQTCGRVASTGCLSSNAGPGWEWKTDRHTHTRTRTHTSTHAYARRRGEMHRNQNQNQNQNQPVRPALPMMLIPVCPQMQMAPRPPPSPSDHHFGCQRSPSVRGATVGTRPARIHQTSSEERAANRIPDLQLRSIRYLNLTPMVRVDRPCGLSHLCLGRQEIAQNPSQLQPAPGLD